jgi:hypothetical protein
VKISLCTAQELSARRYETGSTSSRNDIGIARMSREIELGSHLQRKSTTTSVSRVNATFELPSRE